METSLPLLLPVDLPPRQNGQDDISRPGTGDAHQAQHHNTHNRIAIYRMRIRLFAIHPHVRLPQLHATRRRPPYLATPSRTRAVTFRKPGYRPTRPSGSGFTPAQRTYRLDHQTIRIIRLNGSAACADPMLYCILLLPRPSDNYYHCAAAHTAA